MDTPEELTVEVPAAHAGARLDVTLATLVQGRSRSQLQRLIKDGGVRVSGREVRRPNTPVEAGDRVVITLDGDREVSTDVSGAAILELEVLHEDEAIAVVNKPAGLVCHPNPRQTRGTLSDLARARFGDLPEVQGEDRPGIVHRLDRLTSGVIVLGRSLEALRSLKEQFKEREVSKTYLAVVHGTPRFDSEWRTGAIGASPRNPERMRVVPANLEEDLLERGEARTAETLVERVEDLGPATLVAAHPRTGRTHQIRVHLQDAGLPIVGDRVYSKGGAHREPLPRGVQVMERPALHARRLSFRHPLSGEEVTFEAPLPADMETLLAGLRAAR
ncbi:MAG: RluA family pseudouridine synthase [Planctomycetota bacterium]|jgi:23S rRNA pseudouridine1911/1915/1917 synthase